MKIQQLHKENHNNKSHNLILSTYFDTKYFTFNSKFYLQINDCAMGTICAPTYAHIFMSDFETPYIYPLIKDKYISHLCFIDDIFVVWTKSKNHLQPFINQINKKHHSIKFDFKYFKQQSEFLDTLIYKTHSNRLQTRKYSLHAKSAHPHSLSQALKRKPFYLAFNESFNELVMSSSDLVKQIVKKEYKENIQNQIKKVDNL